MKTLKYYINERFVNTIQNYVVYLPYGDDYFRALYTLGESEDVCAKHYEKYSGEYTIWCISDEKAKKLHLKHTDSVIFNLPKKYFTPKNFLCAWKNKKVLLDDVLNFDKYEKIEERYIATNNDYIIYHPCGRDFTKALNTPKWNKYKVKLADEQLIRIWIMPRSTMNNLYKEVPGTTIFVKPPNISKQEISELTIDDLRNKFERITDI